MQTDSRQHLRMNPDLTLPPDKPAATVWASPRGPFGPSGGRSVGTVSQGDLAQSAGKEGGCGRRLSASPRSWGFGLFWKAVQVFFGILIKRKPASDTTETNLFPLIDGVTAGPDWLIRPHRAERVDCRAWGCRRFGGRPRRRRGRSCRRPGSRRIGRRFARHDRNRTNEREQYTDEQALHRRLQVNLDFPSERVFAWPTKAVDHAGRLDYSQMLRQGMFRPPTAENAGFWGPIRTFAADQIWPSMATTSPWPKSTACLYVALDGAETAGKLLALEDSAGDGKHLGEINRGDVGFRPDGSSTPLSPVASDDRVPPHPSFAGSSL